MHLLSLPKIPLTQFSSGRLSLQTTEFNQNDRENCNFLFWRQSVRVPIFGAGMLIFNYLCNGPLDHGTTSHTGSIHFLEVVVRITEVAQLHLLPHLITALHKENIHDIATPAGKTMGYATWELFGKVSTIRVLVSNSGSVIKTSSFLRAQVGTNLSSLRRDNEHTSNYWNATFEKNAHNGDVYYNIPSTGMFKLNNHVNSNVF